MKKELELYKEGLSSRPALIVANKMDMPEAAENLAEFKKIVGSDTRIFTLSAENNELGDLPDALRELVRNNLAEDVAALRRL